MDKLTYYHNVIKQDIPNKLVQKTGDIVCDLLEKGLEQISRKESIDYFQELVMSANLSNEMYDETVNIALEVLKQEKRNDKRIISEAEKIVNKAFKNMKS